MRRRRRANIEELRMAIDCLPARTREAMLEGIRTNEIIVGGYTDGQGGVCPMLAAHRAGGRTNFIYFAKAWDRFASAEHRTRRATERELLILTSHLEASLLDEAGPAPELAQAIAEHNELLGRRAEPAPDRAGGADRGQELKRRPGWAWMRVVRRYDDFERALERLEFERVAVTDRDGELVG
jgi:hypothetical protein